MSKGQTKRLSKQHKKAGGPKGIFGEEAKTHEDIVTEAGKEVYNFLVKELPKYEFRLREELSKDEINKKLNSIDSRLGKVCFVKDAKIKPDGGIIEVKDKKAQWHIILVSEAKHQGKDVENIQAGTKVGKKKDQDLMVAGNAIERVHKNINEIRNYMLAEKHFPYIVFLQGSNFSTETIEVIDPQGKPIMIRHDSGAMNRIDRVTSANYSMGINENHCKNIIIQMKNYNLMLQCASIYAHCTPWSQEEMVEIMKEITKTSIEIIQEEL